MKIKSPLEFILKKDLVEFDIINKNGVFFIVSGKFKQLIKSSEYKQILNKSVDIVINNDVEDIIEDTNKVDVEIKKRGRPRKEV